MMTKPSSGLHDLINARKHVSHKKLGRLELVSCQLGLLSRGVQYQMDRREPYNWVLEASMGYVGTIGVAAFDDMTVVNERVGDLFLVRSLI